MLILFLRISYSDVATGTNRSRTEYIDFVETLRKGYSDRKLVTESVLVATPADASNKTGAVATTHVITGVQDGKTITITCVAVMRIKWVHKEGHPQGGDREISTDATVLNFSP